MKRRPPTPGTCASPTIEQRQQAARDAFEIASQRPAKLLRKQWWTQTGGKSPLKGGELMDV